MTNHPALLFRVDAGFRWGMGHLARCLVLAQAARDRGMVSKFVIYSDRQICDEMQELGFPCVSRRAVDLGRQADEVCELVGPGEIAVLDFVHGDTLSQADIFPALLREWRRCSAGLVLLDGAGSQSIRSRHQVLDTDILIAPYVDETTDAAATGKTLAGPAYIILSAPYRGLDKRNCREDARRVLVTCGGSDPSGLSLQIVDALENIEAELQIRVVIGPMFAGKLKDELKERASVSRHRLDLVCSPKDLAVHMLWSDIAVSTTGLTKYELAASGTPAVLISIDGAHEEANRKFSTRGTARCIGTAGELADREISAAVTGLLQDYPLRESMARKGQALIDGHGVDRVVDEMLSIYPKYSQHFVR